MQDHGSAILPNNAIKYYTVAMGREHPRAETGVRLLCRGTGRSILHGDGEFRREAECD